MPFIVHVLTLLLPTLRIRVKQSLLLALALALPLAAVFCVYSAGWRFAAYLVIVGRATIGGVFR